MHRRPIRCIVVSGWITVLLALLPTHAADGFRWVGRGTNSLELREGDRPVLAYQHGVILREGMPPDRARSSYIHPLYGLDGEELTDDFPVDHPHHRGLFWSWPHVGIEGRQHDLWMLRGVRHQFERWIAREATPLHGRLEVENGWYVGNERVMAETLRLVAHPATPTHRAIDLEFTWVPKGRPIRLAGAEGKSYGGVTLRYAPGTQTVITTPLGQGPEDLYIERLPWADLSRRWESTGRPSGAALFVARDHPDYPPTWLTRHYGVLCIGWPGVEGRTFPPDEPVRCKYRVWIHRGHATLPDLERAYIEFVNEVPIASPPPGSVQPPPP